MSEPLKRYCITEIDQDRISNLPRNAIDQILSRLSIRDGARTSVLSKMWRYKWSELPCLVFDNSLSSRTLGGRMKFPKFASIIDHVVFLHRGTILKFKYFNDQGIESLENSAMDRWIMHLSKSPIEELTIVAKLDGYCFPPCLFSNQSLIQLLLNCDCTIKIPSTFKGFANLKSLFLRLRKIDENDLEKLILRCPVLVSLTLQISHYLSHVTVVAPNLLFCSVEGNIGGISFENSSRLVDVSILLHGDRHLQVCSSSSNLHKFCAQLPMIRKLKINSGFLKDLTVGINLSNLPSSCANLDSLTLYMNLNVRGDCLGALGVLSIFLNLRKLSIEANFHINGGEALTLRDANIWEDHCLSFRLNKLRFVDIKGQGITGTQHDLNFVKFMLSTSPVLERMVVKANAGYDYIPNDKRMMGVVKKLLSFKRASVNAQVILED